MSMLYLVRKNDGSMIINEYKKIKSDGRFIINFKIEKSSITGYNVGDHVTFSEHELKYYTKLKNR